MDMHTLYTLLSKSDNLQRKYFRKIFFNKNILHKHRKHIWSSKYHTDMLFSPSDQYFYMHNYFFYSLFRNMH